MNRFFVKKDDIEGNSALITGEDVKHISKVLRMAPGDKVMLCDGEGYQYLAEINQITKDDVRLEILSSERCAAEPMQRITLYQGLPKGDKMELIVQKCVELGISEIVPVAAERSIVRIKPGEFGGKRTRYQRVAYEAAKQCGRGIIPEIADLTTFKAADMGHHDLIIIAYEDEKGNTLKSLLRANMQTKDIAIVIGPEGGLESNEVELLTQKGGKAVTLGPRILRTETAGMAALAMILYEIEEQ